MRKRAALAGLLALLWAGPARAEDVHEFWPEVQVFVPLGAPTRLFLDFPYADGEASDHAVLEASAYLDLSLKPVQHSLRR